jgi:hypothetical protein
MYPAKTEYVRAGSFGEACAALDAYGEDAKALAGGQTLIPMMKLRLIKPRLLVDLGKIDGAQDTSFHQQPEAQHPKSSATQAGRPITPSIGGKPEITSTWLKVRFWPFCDLLIAGRAPH